jgi:hypothetical protein
VCSSSVILCIICLSKREIACSNLIQWSEFERDCIRIKIKTGKCSQNVTWSFGVALWTDKVWVDRVTTCILVDSYEGMEQSTYACVICMHIAHGVMYCLYIGNSLSEMHGVTLNVILLICYFVKISNLRNVFNINSRTEHTNTYLHREMEKFINFLSIHRPFYCVWPNKHGGLANKKDQITKEVTNYLIQSFTHAIPQVISDQVFSPQLRVQSQNGPGKSYLTKWHRYSDSFRSLQFLPVHHRSIGPAHLFVCDPVADSGHISSGSWTEAQLHPFWPCNSVTQCNKKLTVN